MKRFLHSPGPVPVPRRPPRSGRADLRPNLGHGGLHRRQLLKSLGTRDLRRDPAPLLRRYFSALHGR